MCKQNAKKLCNDNNCVICDPRRFINSPKLTNWTVKNIDEGKLLSQFSNKKQLLNCNTCKHDHLISPCNISADKGCPYCSGQKLCNEQNCMHCFNKSFQSNKKSKYWSDKNNISPRNVFANAAKKYLFNCHVCNHEFLNSPNSITAKNSWCSYCANRLLCLDNNCSKCFNKSFQSHEKSKYWSKKNVKQPRELFKGTAEKFWFVCENEHEFITSLGKITSSGRWCPLCKNKTECKLLNKLTEYGYSTLHQRRFDWCRNIKTDRLMPFDFVIEEYKLIIELDGNQHFKQVSNWGDPTLQREKDIHKMICANKNGYSVIRLYQEDVLYERNNWLDKLESNFYLHNIPINIFISSGAQYENFM